MPLGTVNNNQNVVVGGSVCPLHLAAPPYLGELIKLDGDVKVVSQRTGLLLRLQTRLGQQGRHNFFLICKQRTSSVHANISTEERDEKETKG